MARLKTNFVRGTLSTDLAIGGTTMSSGSLADLAVVASPDIAVIIIDPAGSAPEIVHVTAHTSSATTATITRAQESTTARAWASGTAWSHGGTITDFAEPDLTTYSETAVTDTDSGATHTIDVSTGTVFNLTLTANCTLTFSNPAKSGLASSFTLKLTQDGTGSRTVTWPASVDWAAATAPTLTTDAAGVDILTFFTTDGGTTWYGFVAGQAMG